MNNKHNPQLDTALTELLGGVPLTTLLEKYAVEKTELEEYAKLLSAFAVLRAEVPQESGLRKALQKMSLSSLAETPGATVSPYLSFFFTYRPMLVLPVLVLLIVGGGFLLRPTPGQIPNQMPAPAAFESTAADSAAQNASVHVQFNAPTNADTPVSKRAAPENTMMLMSAPEVATTTATSTASTSGSVHP